jgi:hypothetical protein
MNKAEHMLRRVRLELARDPEFPNGSTEHGYDFIAPLNTQSHIDVDSWKTLRGRCRVRRFWGKEPEEVGHVVHKHGRTWAFHYDIHGDATRDETGFRFDSHSFVPGEYVSIQEQNGIRRTFRVHSVREII